jgi:hypothetical protein
MSEEEAANKTIAGEFAGADPWAGEAHSELVGVGSLEFQPSGLCVRTQWRPARRRAWTILGVISAIGVGSAFAASAGTVALGVAFFAPVAAGVVVWRRWCREIPYERVIPWEEVGGPSVSDGAVVFSVSEPRRGLARFRVAGYGFKELRLFAQAIKARGR